MAPEFHWNPYIADCVDSVRAFYILDSPADRSAKRSFAVPTYRKSYRKLREDRLHLLFDEILRVPDSE